MLLKILQLSVAALLLMAGIATAGQGIWQNASNSQVQAKGISQGGYAYRADQIALRNLLSLVPHQANGDFSQQIELPMPDGSLARFQIVESPIMKPALAARYPEIKTFKVFGVDDPLASGRVDITPKGFHAMLFTAKGRLFIDPDPTSTQSGQYLSRYRSGQPAQKFTCEIHTPDFEDNMGPVVAARTIARISGELLQYDLAVAATEEYVSAVFDEALPEPDPIVQAQAAIVTAINRVSAIYERDLGIRLELVGTNDELIENGDNVSFSNGDVFAMLDENQVWLDKKLTSLGYDIGHVFGTGNGGAALLGSTCNNSVKAKGVTGQNDDLEDDSFYIDYVAHEIGHQFNAEHSFNGTTLACGNGRNQATAFEPGSGSTIMAYAGICVQENLQLNSDATFHAGSIAQIDSFTKGVGDCAVQVATTPANNNDPMITAIEIANRTIPANTPFVLDGTASDMELDTLEYQWDQMDAGCPTDTISFGTDNGSNALFRSYLPRGQSWRNFPALGTQVQGRFDKAEVLPCQNRDLNFRLTARDGNSGQDSEDVRVAVDNSAGPFEITNLKNPVTPIYAGTAFEVIWDVAKTDLPPINCLNVEFDLVSFSAGYARYSIYPLGAASNLNDGIEYVTLDPTIANPISAPHLRSRVRVKCSNNIFYDLSDTDLTIEGDMRFGDKDLIDTALAAYSFANPALAMGTVVPACGAVVDCTAPPVDNSGSKGGGSGAFDYLWLLMMTGLIGFVKLCRRYGLQ
jgi:hypothetical protein